MTDDIALSNELDDQKLLAQVVDYYHRSLKENAEALDFLRAKGITNAQALDHFRIGFANRTLGVKLPVKQLKSGREIRGRLEALNIFRSSSGHEHFNGCVVFPILSADGSRQIVDIYGRKVGGHLRKGTPMDMFLATERRGVWNIDGFGVKDEVLICTSIFEALIFWNYGHHNVTCMFGDDALTDDHRTACKEFGIRRVMTTSEAIAPKIIDAGMDCFLLRLPSGHSAHEYAVQFDDPAAALGAVIRRAEWIGKGKRSTTTPPKGERTPSVEGPATAMPSDDTGATIAAPSPATGSDDATASPVPSDLPPLASATPEAVEAEQTGDQRDEVVMNLGHRRYRIRGLAKNLSYDMMRVNVLASTDKGLFVDTFDLYSARHRKTFVTQAGRLRHPG